MLYRFAPLTLGLSRGRAGSAGGTSLTTPVDWIEPFSETDVFGVVPEDASVE
jgi:hypothetical protein